MRRRLFPALVTGLAAIAVGGCGSASTASGPTADAVARAADVTAQVPGYKIAAQMSITTAQGPLSVSMSGVIDRANRTGELTTHESVVGHALNLTERFSGLTFYMQATGLPGVSAVAHGKPWLKFDMSRALGAIGVSSLPTGGTDPSQFVDYLRAVSTKTTKLGNASIRGVVTTHYHATIDLKRYTQLVAAPERAAAARSVSTLESALGGHTLPVDVWIDNAKLVRRIKLTFPECVSNQHVTLAMTMDLFGYGQQPTTQIPSAGQTYDLTPLLAKTMSNVKLGCTTT